MGLYALLPAGLALATGLELAQGPTPGQTALSHLDTDRDGSISRIEAQMNPALSAQFGILDQNENGALEASEFSRFEAESAAPPAAYTPARQPVAPPLTRTPPPLSSTPPPQGTSPQAPPSPR